MRVFDRNFIRADGISRKATGVSRSSKHARAAMCVPDLGEGEGTFRLFVEGDVLFDEMIAAIERATRDIVSRAIYEEMRQGRTSPYGGVYISMAHLGPENVAKKFQGMVKRCADSGFDLAAGLVEVVPTAHYLMGHSMMP